MEVHCLPCHGAEKTEGRLDLRAPLLPSQWQEAWAQVDREEMPPRAPFPSPQERQAILDWLQTGAAAPDSRDRPAPTHTRLTRAELNRSVRSLVGLDLRPGDLLEADPQGETGFTNDAESLQVTPSQAATWLEAAERAVEGWFAADRPGAAWTVRREAETMDRSSPHLKDFDRGVLFATEPQVISLGVDVPVDGHYELRVHGSTLGLPTRLQVLLGTEPLSSLEITHPRPGTTTHRIPVLLRKGWQVLSFHQVNLVPQSSLPRDSDQVMNQRAARNRMVVPELPADSTPEQQEARRALEEACLYLQQAFEWLFAYGADGDPRDIVRFRDYATERIARESELRRRYAEDVLRVPWDAFDRDWKVRNGPILRTYEEHLAKISGIKWMDWTRHQGQLYVDWIELTGPVIPVGTRPRATRGLDWEAFVRDAWRGVAPETELAHYREFWESSPRDEDTLRALLASVLASPRFLFRDQRDPGTRLSFFLHGAPGDDRTRRELAAGPAAYRKTIQRLLREPGFEESLADFTGQWLGTASLAAGHSPDEYRFPNYKRHLALAAREEPTRFLLRLIREGRPLTELLESDWTMANRDLARFYGIPEGPERENEWMPVRLPDDRRGGLLGMSAVLTTTSSPVRTTPVARGKWVWETLLGRNPGEPLPDAGVLPATAGEEGLPLREELERHRADPRCIRCHEKLDPIGLSLENFDAVGQWREESGGRPVNASGRFFRGSEFTGPVGLRAELLRLREEFLAELIRRLLAYSHGRDCDDEIGWIQAISDRVRDADWSATVLWEEVALNLLEHGPE